MVADCLADRRVDLMTLLAPATVDEGWEADKAGWRAFVMGIRRPDTGPGAACRRHGSAGTTLRRVAAITSR